MTPRERDVLVRVLRGLENKSIAAELGIAEQSVKEHVSALLTKFAVPNRASLVAETSGRIELTGGLTIDRSWIPQLFLQALPDICILRGPDLRIEAVNDAFRRHTGDRPLLGRTLREALPELETDGILEVVGRVYKTGEPFIEHGRRPGPHGVKGIPRPLVDIVLQPLRAEDGTINGVVAFAITLTEAAAGPPKGSS